ncbi:hypothetical protein [Dehalobacter sp. TBBPA1]|uniref:hypothetical protein n=1 Tax=Dehalobacter sp. TBBPA1 TaxID=3235037 RepID=UPI0034A261A3
MRKTASLACKILGIFFIIQGTNVLSSILIYSVSTPNAVVHESLLNAIFSLVYILFGFLLWIFSGKLSLILTKEEHYSNEGSGLRSVDLQRVLFSVLGLYFIGHSVPRLVSALMSMYPMNGISTTRVLFSSIGIITELIIGLGIFFGSQGLVRLLDLIRTAGLKRENNSENEE